MEEKDRGSWDRDMLERYQGERKYTLHLSSSSSYRAPFPSSRLPTIADTRVYTPTHRHQKKERERERKRIIFQPRRDSRDIE